MKIKKKKTTIKGTFSGYLPNGDLCATGKFKLISLKSLKKKIKKLKRKAARSPFVKKETKEKLKKQDVLEQFQVSVLNANENLSVFCKTKVVKIELWDNQIEDGDIISIRFNDKVILDHYRIKNKKKIIMLKLEQKENVLEFTANDTGISGKNTVTINVKEINKATNVTTSLDKDEKAKIVLIQE